jgi:hypothetical protein
MQIDLLLAEHKGLALHGRGAADEGFQPHAEDFGVKAYALRFIGRGENQVVEVTDHDKATVWL